MVYFLAGFVGFLFMVESLFSPIRNLIRVTTASSEEVYLKVVEYEGYSANDYLDIVFFVIGIALIIGSIGFWLKSKAIL